MKGEISMDNLSLLGKNNEYPTQYCPEILEVFQNRHMDIDYMVKFNCPEFTSLCPITNQPDYAAIYINYIPSELMVESKSLKMYLFGFRNHGDFHENCVNTILKDLRELMKPKFIEVQGKFTPRGGISIDPYTCWGIPDTRYAELADFRLKNHDLFFENVNNR
ncbi:MAG: preQ(1) synthase [Defluviitaleaceae bacterium]|nr:preQ(1) synthase [Defluviitaleaceae bacterium]